jgi:hypothetical protein
LTCRSKASGAHRIDDRPQRGIADRDTGRAGTRGLSLVHTSASSVCSQVDSVTDFMSEMSAEMDHGVSTYPFINWLGVMLVLSVVSVGTICRPSDDTYTFDESFVVQSNEPVL